jgi:hypothetical protein
VGRFLGAAGGAAAWLGVVLALAVASSWLFSWPRGDALARVRRGNPGAAPHRAALLRGAAVSVGYVLFLALVSLASPIGLLGVSALAVATAIALDLVAEARARWRADDLTAVWRAHDLAAVDLSIDALVRNGIDVHTRGAYLRALLWALGPFAPVVLMVPTDRAAEAREILDAVMRPAPVRGEGTAELS